MEEIKIINFGIAQEIIIQCGLDAYKIYRKIFNHINPLTKVCYPNISQLTKECKCSKEDINGCLDIGNFKYEIPDNYYFPWEISYSNEELKEIYVINNYKKG